MSRGRWVASHLVLSVTGSAVIIMVAGLAAGIAHASETGRARAIFRVTGAAALATFLFVGELGPLIPLDQWAMNLWPFTHIPRMPGPTFDATRLVALTVAALVLGTAGVLGFARRDVG